MGITSKISGASFERQTEISAQRKNWVILKIPEGCRRIGKSVIPIKSPFDFISSKNSTAVFFDSKTIKSGNFTHSKINQRQIDKLILLEQSGQIAGYLIYFRDKKTVAFYTASNIRELKKGEHLNNPTFLESSMNGIFNFDLFLEI